jgi:hypothetical protein
MGTFFSKFTENINSYTVDKKGSESNRIGAILTCEWGSVRGSPPPPGISPHCKKKVTDFPVFSRDIPSGDGKTVNLFLQSMHLQNTVNIKPAEAY